jgi:hypothetical protein
MDKELQDQQSVEGSDGEECEQPMPEVPGPELAWEEGEAERQRMYDELVQHKRMARAQAQAQAQVPSEEGEEVQQDPPKEDQPPPPSKRSEYRHIKGKLDREELPSLEILQRYVRKYGGEVPDALQAHFNSVVLAKRREQAPGYQSLKLFNDFFHGNRNTTQTKAKKRKPARSEGDDATPVKTKKVKLGISKGSREVDKPARPENNVSPGEGWRRNFDLLQQIVH